MEKPKEHRGRKKRITRKKVLEVIPYSMGNHSTVAQRLNVSRAALCLFLKKNPDLREKIDEDEENMIDIAINQVGVKIKEGDIKTCKWYLENKAKHRGYGKTIIEGNIKTELSFKERFKQELDFLEEVPKEVKMEILNKIKQKED